MIEQVNNGISHTLYEVSSALLLPVMLTVLVLLVMTLVSAGGFLREWIDRRTTRAALSNALKRLARGASDAEVIWNELSKAPSGVPRMFLTAAGLVETRPADIAPATLTKALNDLENGISRSLGRVGLIARVGPMLGLLGTLIPFGPALAGLSTGDVRELSANLVTAFSTTVVGLLCGAIAFVISSVRRSWYGQDFDDLDHLVWQVCEEQHGKNQEAEVGCV